MYDRIVVALDGSALAEAVLPHASPWPGRSERPSRSFARTIRRRR